MTISHRTFVIIHERARTGLIVHIRTPRGIPTSCSALCRMLFTNSKRAAGSVESRFNAVFQALYGTGNKLSRVRIGERESL